MKNKIIGSMTALITPFKDQKIDFATYEKLIKRQIKLGIDVLVPMGTTGECATLTHEEHKECIKVAVEVAKNSNAKILAGAGSNATHEAIELAKFAQKIGADGILSVAPYYNKPTQEGLFLHFKAIADSIDIPVLLYNVPGRTGSDIKAETAIRLHKECNNIYGIKEATGLMDRCVQLGHLDKDFTVISGEDEINYPILANGGVGVISVTSNILPDLIAKQVSSALNGDFATSKNINDELYPINKVLFCESNPIPIKAAMHIAGLLDTLEYRLPLCKPSKESMQKIENVIKKYDIKGF